MLTQIDFGILNFIQQYIAGPALDTVMAFITHLGDYGILWIGICLVFLTMPKHRKNGLILASAMVAGLIICNLLLKNIIARPRPFMINDFPIIINPPMGYSFPSGHSSISFVAASVIAARYRKYAPLAYLTASLIALSRIYLYVHYPSDVVAGALMGILIGVATVRIFDKKPGQSRVR